MKKKEFEKNKIVTEKLLDARHDTSVNLASELINTLAQRVNEDMHNEALNLNEDEAIDFMGTTLAHEVYQGHDDSCKKSAMKRFCDTVECFMQNGEIVVAD